MFSAVLCVRIKLWVSYFFKKGGGWVTTQVAVNKIIFCNTLSHYMAFATYCSANRVARATRQGDEAGASSPDVKIILQLSACSAAPLNKKCKKQGGWVVDFYPQITRINTDIHIVPTFYVGMHPKTLCVDLTTKMTL